MSAKHLSDPITLRLPTDVLAEVEKIAQTCDRTRSWVMVRALRHYLAQEGRDILAVREGRDQVEAGDVHDLNDVLKEVDSIIASRVA